MKNCLALLLFLPLYSIAQDDEGKEFTVKGKLNDFPDSLNVEWVYLSYRVNGEGRIDSTQPDDDKYEFTGRIHEPIIAKLSVKFAEQNGHRPVVNGKRDGKFFFLEPGKQKAISTDSLSNLKVKSSKAQADYAAYLDKARPYNESYLALVPQYNKFREEKNLVELEKVEKELNKIDSLRKEDVYAEWVRTKPNSPIAVYALQQYAGWDINPDKVEPLYNLLSEKAKSYPSARNLHNNMEIAKRTGIGRIAMDFTQDDTLGNPVSLSSFRGKFVLIDFWASWCGPCRAENPNVVNVYNKHKDNNFHIVGVSLDRPGQKERWMKAIHDDGLYWTQLSDLKFWDNEVARQYGIRAIPQNLLLDPDGRIIAKNLRGEELAKKVDEVVAKKGF